MNIETRDVCFVGGSSALEKIERLFLLSEAKVHESEAGEPHWPIRREFFQPNEYASRSRDIPGEAVCLAQRAEDVGKITGELQSFFQGFDAFAVFTFLNQRPT